jgi:excisionase family DNA binding protein
MLSSIVVIATAQEGRHKMTTTQSDVGARKVAFSISEVCAQTGIGRDGIYKAIQDGRLVARKLGRRTVILDSDLHEFLQALPRMCAAA